MELSLHPGSSGVCHAYGSSNCWPRFFLDPSPGQAGGVGPGGCLPLQPWPWASPRHRFFIVSGDSDTHLRCCRVVWCEYLQRAPGGLDRAAAIVRVALSPLPTPKGREGKPAPPSL